MTRFARAKGSKASNEKAPEDGTPWEVMKDQLMKAKKESEEAKKRQEAEQQRIENYENFLKERRVKKQPSSWCDFPEAPKVFNKKENKNAKTPVDNKNNHSNSSFDLSKTNGKISLKAENKKLKNSNTVKNIEVPENSNIIKKNKKKKNKRKVDEQNCEKVSDDVSNSISDAVESEPTLKKKKKEKTQLQNSKNQVIENDSPQANPTKKKNKKHKFNIKNADNRICNENVDESMTTGEENAHKKQKNKKKIKTLVSDILVTDNNSSLPEKNIVNKKNKDKAKKNKKVFDGKPVRRKEINDKSFQLIINGKEVELVRFDGFPIMKKDAERLAELKDSMIKKGIPKSEVQRTMKLERRRAEKALARLKRDVCYNCRKGGHNLSDCPELKSKIPGVDAAEGVCFKCGSTEHRQFECKVQRDKEFRFATCFICHESGHIARQCPDNPKGLYPNGGSCKLCGDVTHLRKDCPTQNNKKEETSVKLDTLTSADNIEDIGYQNMSKAISTSQETSKKPKKIKF